MEDFVMPSLDGTDIDRFIKEYRDALKQQRDYDLSTLRQQKRNEEANIMSNANKVGMMYSNFPERSKIQNESTFLNKAANINSTYQTGLDKLRQNAADVYNDIKAYEYEYNKLNGSGDGTSGGSGDSIDGLNGNGSNSDTASGDLAGNLNDFSGNVSSSNSGIKSPYAGAGFIGGGASAAAGAGATAIGGLGLGALGAGAGIVGTLGAIGANEALKHSSNETIAKDAAGIPTGSWFDRHVTTPLSNFFDKFQ